MEEFLAQCRPVDTEYFGRPALVATREIHHRRKQWMFHFTQYQVVQLSGIIAVEIPKIFLQCFFGQVSERPVSDLNKRCLF